MIRIAIFLISLCLLKFPHICILTSHIFSAQLSYILMSSSVKTYKIEMQNTEVSWISNKRAIANMYGAYSKMLNE